jgi:hypothetical protein
MSLQVLNQLNFSSASVTTVGSAIYQDKAHRPLLQRQQQTQLQSHQNQKNIMKYFGGIIENIAKNANSKQVCCLDFLINDIADIIEAGINH